MVSASSSALSPKWFLRSPPAGPRARRQQPGGIEHVAGAAFLGDERIFDRWRGMPSASAADGLIAAVKAAMQCEARDAVSW